MKEGCTWPTQGPNICSLSHSPNIQRRISIFSLVNIYIDLPCTYFFIQTSLSTRQFILISLRTHPSFCAQFDGTHIKKFSGLIEFTYCRRLIFLIECRIPFWEPSLNLTFSLMTVLLAIFLALGRYHQFNLSWRASAEAHPLAENVVFEVWIGPEAEERGAPRAT